jgi:sec-independent protein translocase protein TatB
VFNIEGSELIFLLLIALIVLGPEKLPDAIRKAGRAYAEFKKMANGFQGELKQALDEPMRELRDTADAMRAAANFDLGGDATTPASTTTEATEVPPVRREQGLNFGSANPRRTEPAAASSDVPAVAKEEPTRPQGLNFGSANPRRQEREQPPTPEPAETVVPEVPESPAPPVVKERPPGGTPVPRNRPAPAPVAEPVPDAEHDAEDVAEDVPE